MRSPHIKQWGVNLSRIRASHSTLTTALAKTTMVRSVAAVLGGILVTGCTIVRHKVLSESELGTPPKRMEKVLIFLNKGIYETKKFPDSPTLQDVVDNIQSQLSTASVTSDVFHVNPMALNRHREWMSINSQKPTHLLSITPTRVSMLNGQPTDITWAIEINQPSTSKPDAWVTAYKLNYESSGCQKVHLLGATPSIECVTKWTGALLEHLRSKGF